MNVGLLLRDHSCLNEPFDIGVVTRYPRYLPLADQVQPRVANMDVKKQAILRALTRRPILPLNNCNCRAGGSHTAQFRMGKTVFPNLLVGRLQRLDQRFPWVVAAKVPISRDHPIHRYTARFLATLITAHAVRYNRQAPFAQEFAVIVRLPITKGILVVLTETTNIGLAGYLNASANLHPRMTSGSELTGMMNSMNIKMIVFGIGLRIIEAADLTLKGKVKIQTTTIA